MVDHLAKHNIVIRRGIQKDICGNKLVLHPSLRGICLLFRTESGFARQRGFSESMCIVARRTKLIPFVNKELTLGRQCAVCVSRSMASSLSKFSHSEMPDEM